MTSSRLTTLGIPIWITVTVACSSSSSFTGAAGKTAAAAPAKAGAGSASPGTAEHDANTGVDAANAGDPCAGDTSAAAKSAANNTPAAKSLLFYAPASYSVNGDDSEGDTNDYLNGVVAGLTGAGWKVTVVTSIGDGGTSFDACSLHKSFKQVWLWLPCNSAQNMDDASFAGAMKYYDDGGGLVVLADNHFFVAGDTNNHCDATDWLGSNGSTSDAARVAKHMGLALQAGAYGGGTTTPNTTHPLSQALQGLDISLNWPQNVITTIPSGAIWLPIQSSGNYAALIDQTTAPPAGGAPAKLGAYITSSYKYHDAPADDDVTGLTAIAGYFDAHEPTATPAAAKGAGLALADAAGSAARVRFDPSVYRSRTTPPSANDLRQMVSSGDKQKVAAGLRGLAKLNAISLDDLLAYHDDNRWLVRFSAALAAGSLPPASVVPTLTANLHAASLTPDMAIFCGRALAAARATEALPDLQAAALTFASAPYVPEHNVQGELQAAINDLRTR